MLRVMISVMFGIGLVAPAYAEQPPSAPTQNQPGRRAGSAVPPNGIIHPAPDASRGNTVTPPNVDPGMAVRPPGTPGGNPNVVPK
ncbi:MAG: hypothetical protein ABSE20_17465 [Acetobacteraceae bacterium]|jgi:hypothetical protein